MTIEEDMEAVRVELRELYAKQYQEPVEAWGVWKALDRIIKERDELTRKRYRQNEIEHKTKTNQEIAALRQERDELLSAVRQMHQCERAEPTHAMPKDASDRAWCLDCCEWCYASNDMACSGCVARSILQRTEGEVIATPNRP